jgi:ornithine cyclodeaminase/alanine dehydrogenase-like protein (mu-crystallin family)
MSKVLILSERDVEELLTMEACIGVMEEALSAAARGEVHNPLRQVIRPPGASGFLGLMPAYRGGERPLYGLKEVCVFPGNPARGLDTHLGAVLLHDGETGELLAAVNAAAVTAIRTAAVSAVATKLLARPESTVLAILGAGAQARSHLKAMRLVRPIRKVKVFSRSRAKALALGDVEVVDSAQEAVRDADLIVTATAAREPILRREWIRDGAHINAVGSSIATARELDSATVAAASLWVDRRESTVNEAGDYLFALREGAIGEGHIRGELGELLIGAAVGRTSPNEITLFKSLGIAIEDLASAAFLYDQGRAQGRGQWVEF